MSAALGCHLRDCVHAAHARCAIARAVAGHRVTTATAAVTPFGGVQSAVQAAALLDELILPQFKLPFEASL